MDIDLTYSRLPGAVVNDAHLTQEAIEVAKMLAIMYQCSMNRLLLERIFRLYRRIPRCFAFIGSDSKYDLHHPKYHPDERILEKVPQYFVQLVQRLLT